MDSALRLLVVEDEEAVRTLLEQALREGGFKVELASNGADALALLEDREADLRGLITDINLGAEPDGWEIARRAREIFPNLPVVYMSGSASQEWTSKGVPQSVFVAKPFATAQVITGIAGLLNASDGSS